MEKLSKDWLTQGLIDFEYKKYLLLAYLQTARKSFSKVELYPFLADLIFHYRNLMSVKENKTLIRESFPKEISPEEIRHLELRYREIVEDDAIMAELDAIIEFARRDLHHARVFGRAAVAAWTMASAMTSGCSTMSVAWPTTPGTITLPSGNLISSQTRHSCSWRGLDASME